MGSSLVRRLIVLCAIFAMPAVGLAQEAVLTGTVTDIGSIIPRESFVGQPIHRDSRSNQSSGDVV